MTEENRLLRAALTYAGRGWAVIPLHTPTEGGCSCRSKDCKSVGKHPRTQNGSKDAATDEEQVRAWWAMWPDANVGIACEPSNIAVLDIDPRHGGDETLRDLMEAHGDGWLNTVTSLTGGGGTHYLYEMPDPPVRNGASVFGNGIDVRGKPGGYIVAPPSMHESGEAYEWERSANEVTLAEWPRVLARKGKDREPARVVGGVIAQGERDETLTSLAGSMRRRGMSESAILAALREENNERCDPPLPDADLRRIARSIARYDPADDAVLKVRSGNATFEHLRKVNTQPPEFILRVGGTDVRMSAATLKGFDAFRTAVLEQTSTLLPWMKRAEWDDQLSALLDNIEEVSAPRDASDHGLIWQSIVDYLSRREDTNEERFEQGIPIEKESNVYMTGSMLRQWLVAAGHKVEQRRLWNIIQEHGGTQKNTRINKRQTWVWAVPLEALSGDLA